MSHIGNDAIIDAQRDEIADEEHLNNCHCDECEGACTDGDCGECFVCEEVNDGEMFWQANRADILGL